MKDLDFDELDRAVNSLIGGPSAPANLPVDSAVVDAPVADEATTPAAPVAYNVPTVASSPQPLATRRNSGRFMDVVHPSSDMRTASVPARPVAREGVMIQPVADKPVAEVGIDSSVAVEPATSSGSPEWPDPLDFHSLGGSELNQSEIVNTPVEPNKPTDDSDLPDLESATPLESPFLPDAKVEKRPLGAFADATVTPGDAARETMDVDVTQPRADENTDRPIGSDTPLPAELQDDLLSIEDNEDTAQADDDVIYPEPQSPVIETMSIPQQYVEQPSTGDKPANSSIFDVEAYHKPVQVKKTKSSWLMVLWIVLLIILGIGAGAGFYFYLRPLL